MTPHADILDQPESLKGGFLFAVLLHVTLFAAVGIYNLVHSSGPAFGDKNAGGGAVGIEAVKAIPIPHTGMQNPLANETESQVPQQPAKPVEKEKKEVVSPKAIALKMRDKKRPADVASEKQIFRPFTKLDSNQVFAQQAPQVSSPLYSALPGSGRIGTGANTTLGTQFAGYAQQIQQLVSQKWKTGDVDARIQTAPVVVVTFDLMRDGSVRNLRLVQKSGVPTLDYSVQRAIQDASPFPPIPSNYPRDSAQVEFTFELRR